MYIPFDLKISSHWPKQIDSSEGICIFYFFFFDATENANTLIQNKNKIKSNLMKIKRSLCVKKLSSRKKKRAEKEKENKIDFIVNVHPVHWCTFPLKMTITNVSLFITCSNNIETLKNIVRKFICYASFRLKYPLCHNTCCVYVVLMLNYQTHWAHWE